MSLVFANQATATLAGAITNTSLNVNLSSGEGALFPNPTGGQSFTGTFVDAATGLLQQSQVPTSIVFSGIDPGAVNSIIATVSPTIGALTNLDLFEVSIAFANTMQSVQMDISGTGEFPVKRADGTALQPGDIQDP